MNTTRRKWVGVAALAGAVGLAGGCAMMQSGSHTHRVTLSGANEVPPVSTSASGTGTVTVKTDRSVSARITVSGMAATASHIHVAPAGANGPVIVPFVKQGDNTFVAAEGAKMTESQYEAYMAGRTYVNVHSAKNPDGEVRAQLSNR